MREKKNMLNGRMLKMRLNEIEALVECIIFSIITAAGMVGLVLMLSGISVERLGVMSYAKFTVVATVVFFAIFMGNYLDKRNR